jgi:hypothetical protein
VYSAGSSHGAKVLESGWSSQPELVATSTPALAADAPAASAAIVTSAAAPVR